MQEYNQNPKKYVYHFHETKFLIPTPFLINNQKNGKHYYINFKLQNPNCSIEP